MLLEAGHAGARCSAFVPACRVTWGSLNANREASFQEHSQMHKDSNLEGTYQPCPLDQWQHVLGQVWDCACTASRTATTQPRPGLAQGSKVTRQQPQVPPHCSGAEQQAGRCAMGKTSIARQECSYVFNQSQD